MLARMIIEPISRHADAFSRAVFDAFAPFCLIILGSLTVLGFIFVAFKALSPNEMNEKFFMMFIEKGIIFTIVSVALGAHTSFYWDYIHEPIKLSSDAFVTKIVSITPRSTREAPQNSKSMIDTVENTITEAMTLLYSVSEKAGFLSLHAGFLALIIWVLFVASEAIFALYLLGNTLKLAALSALSPFLILACAFDKTRGHAIAGIKYVLTSVLNLMIAAFCMGLFLFALREVVVNISPDNIPKSEVFSVLSTMLILSLVSIYFLLIAPEMASVIMGSQSSSVLPGIVAGAMTTSTAYIGTRVGGFVGSATKWTAGKVADWGDKSAELINTYRKGSSREKFDKNYASSSSQ